MQEYDNIQRFLFENQAIRGEIAHLNQSFLAILQQHPYPPLIRKLLGETLGATVLLVDILKFKGTLTIQFQGNGPISLLVAKCDHEFNIRGLAKFAEASDSHEFQTAFANGKLVITITAENEKPYQSIVPLNGLTISECLEDFFLQSEQLPTKIWLQADDNQVTGMLLQILPTNPSIEKEQLENYAAKLNKEWSGDNLFAMPNEMLLQSVFPGDDLRLFNRKSTTFKCSCTLEKMRNAIKIMGEEESRLILLSNNSIEVTCEFCNQQYAFDKTEIAAIFNQNLH